MSKSKSKIDGRQLNYLAYVSDEKPEAGSMNLDIRIRHAVSNAIKVSGKDRIDICAEMYKLTGIEVSKATLDSWSAESRSRASESLDYNGNKRWGIPGEMIAAFCYVTNDWEIQNIIAEAGRHKVLEGKDVLRARVGELRESIAYKKGEIREIEKVLLRIK